MNLVTHVFRKDIRHLRWLLVGWFLMVALQTGLMASGSAAWNNDAPMQVALRMLGFLIPAVKWILLIVLVPLLLQDEPLTDHTAFWLTRPIGRKDLLRSKGLFLALLIIIPPALAEFGTLAVNGIGPADLAIALPEILWDAILGLLPVIALAVVTSSFSRFAIAGASVYAALIVLSFLWQMYRMFTNMEGMMSEMTDASLGLSREILLGLLSIIVLGFAIIHQYLTRRTRRTVAFYVLYALLAAATEQWWQWDFMAAGGIAGTESQAIRDVTVRLDNTYVSDASSFRPGKDREKQIRASFQCSNLPAAHFARLKTIDARLVFTNGAEVSHTQRRPEISYDFAPDTEALESLLEPCKLVSRERSTGMGTLMKLKADLYDEHRFEKADLTAQLAMNLFRYDVTAKLPLRAGEGAKEGTTAMTISDVLKNSGGCTVVLGEKRFSLKFKKQRGQGRYDYIPQMNAKSAYLLVNPRLQEAYLPERNADFDFDPISNASRLKVNSPRYSFILKEGGEDTLKTPEAIEDWLRDAELWWINVREAGSFSAEVRDPAFELNDRNHINTKVRSDVPPKEIAQ